MSKQDRTFTRTASDLERKYDLGKLKNGVGSDSIKVSQLEQTLSQHIADTGVELENMSNSIEEVETSLNEYKEETDLKLEELEYTLPTASATELGGVMIGNNVEIDENGKISVPVVNGVSPTITVDTINDGYRLTITDADGTKSIDIMNGTTAEQWTLLTSKTGTTGTIALPAEFSELHITIGLANYTYTFNILASDLSNEEVLFRDGFYISASTFGDAYVSVTKTQITAWTVRKEGVVKEVTIKVYYK